MILRHRCWIRSLLGLMIAGCVMSSALAYASTEPPQPPPESLPDSPLLISAYATQARRDATQQELIGSAPVYLELYNTSEAPVAMTDWLVTVGMTDHRTIKIKLDSDKYMAPHQYSVVSFNGAVAGANFEISWQADRDGAFVSDYGVSKQGYAAFTTSLTQPSAVGNRQKELNTTSTGYTTTGRYHDDVRASIYQQPLYKPRMQFPLAPIEILANAQHCPPTDQRLLCGDYVKFYNPTEQPINFTGTRLRLGYQGQRLSTANTIPLDGNLAPGDYMIVRYDAQGEPLTITNTGGYVWLEDSYGLVTYPNTITQYSNATSATHSGQSWAYDAVTQQWGWAVPQPLAHNQLIPSQPTIAAASNSSLKPCRPDQYRNPSTHRCRKRSTTTTPKPCRANQFRNPASGRCKLLASLTGTTYKPCRPGWRRNAQTHRCRKIKAASTDVQGYAIQKVPPDSSSFLSWWLASGIGALVTGRLVWEWRHELSQWVRKLVHLE